MAGSLFCNEEYFQTYQLAIVANLIEANAPAFHSDTGRIQVAIKHVAGTITAGEITVYIQALNADAVYTMIPTAQWTAVAATNQVRAPLDLGGPCYFKLVITTLAGAGGGPSFNLYWRSCHV